MHDAAHHRKNLLSFLYKVKTGPMKLKLSTQDDITILSVSEDLKPNDSAILRAGIQKLLQSKKTNILLDLTEVKGAAPGEVGHILQLPIHFASGDTQVALCGSLAELGKTTTRDEAIQALKSPLAKQMAAEALLKRKLEMLEKLKAEFTQKLGQSSGPDVKTLRKENSDLKQRIHSQELHVGKLLKTRKPPQVPDDSKTKEIVKTTLAVLGMK